MSSDSSLNLIKSHKIVIALSPLGQRLLSQQWTEAHATYVTLSTATADTSTSPIHNFTCFVWILLKCCQCGCGCRCHCGWAEFYDMHLHVQITSNHLGPWWSCDHRLWSQVTGQPPPPLPWSQGIPTCWNSGGHNSALVSKRNQSFKHGHWS